MKIDFAFTQLLQTRQNIIKILKKYEGVSTVIPTGFKNSILWNAAHCVAAQQGLCYNLSSVPKNVSDEFISAYRKGSLASETINPVNVPELIQVLESTANQMITDYQSGIFKTYQQYETSYGIVLHNIEEAILFNNVHEALHLGYMMAQVKSIHLS